MEFWVLVLIIVAIVLWTKVSDLRRRLDLLESQFEQQRDREREPAVGRRTAEPLKPVSAPPPTAPPPAPPAGAAPTPAPARMVAPPPAPSPASPIVTTPRPDTPAAVPAAAAPTPVRPAAAPHRPAAASPVAAAPPTATAPPPSPPPPSEPRVWTEEPPRRFDWESLVGVKLFSAIAGIALVIAAIFFLKFSIDQGWLQPPVRFAIGVITAIALLVVCEMKAARRYRVTANAMDAAAIAILFSTFFAGHALWNLIPGSVTFGLLALVTVVAVLLSIRRDSLFIAVLGLLGGFATPILLSTGENQPIPLFAYLLLLNVGLAWVAYHKRWTSVTWLSLVFTTIYQWGWVFEFLDASQLPLAMGIFLIFPLAAVGGLLVSRAGGTAPGDAAHRSFERGALISAVVPTMFAVYLAAVPEYGARPALLFGFVLLIDAGLFAIALARREAVLHAVAGVTTVLTMAIWFALSYEPGAWTIVLPFVAAFVVFFMMAPAIEGVVTGGRALTTRAALTAGMLLFVFPVLAGIEPATSDPRLLFAVLVALVVFIAWRAASMHAGHVYHVAAFFAVAAQAVWSAKHLTIDRLDTAVLLYAVFGLVSLAAPVAARRTGRPLTPAWGSGLVLLGSLALLLFLSIGSVAPAALWALALLLAILNAALFVESAAGRLPLLSQIGSLLSWVILASWWAIAGAAVGVIPSLFVLTLLTLVTLAGHAWSVREQPADLPSGQNVAWSNGLYLALVGHLFLLVVAANRAWSIPPQPLFGALLVMTLATSAASLYGRTGGLHVGGTVAAALVIAQWCAIAGAPPYGLVALIAVLAVVVYALVWIRLLRGQAAAASAAAAATAFIGAVGVIAATAGRAQPPFAGVVIAHAANIAVLLALARRRDWRVLAAAAVAPAWLAVLQWQWLPSATPAQILILAGVLYALFVGYPFAIGRRAVLAREPYLAAILASAMFFFAGRTAFMRGGLEWMIGVVPVATGVVLAILLRQLLRLQQAGERDMGRLALVAGAALGFVTVAIPLQLEEQWITIGWALEGAALAWLFRRIPHRGLLYAASALFVVVFVRLAANPWVLVYEPRGELRIFNWYLYTYLVCAGAMLIAGWWLSKTDDTLPLLPRPSRWLPAFAVIVLFLLVNIEIADYYATGPEIVFRFGATVSQDLTYTIAWLIFGMALLAAGIALGVKAARVTAVALIAITTFKCFLYDLRELEGLYRVASFVGLAMSLALVALALQKYVLSRPRNAT
jgi:uncharacterized membrane protein